MRQKTIKAMKLEPQQFREKAVLLTPLQKKTKAQSGETCALDLTASEWQRPAFKPRSDSFLFCSKLFPTLLSAFLGNLRASLRTQTAHLFLIPGEVLFL